MYIYIALLLRFTNTRLSVNGKNFIVLIYKMADVFLRFLSIDGMFQLIRCFQRYYADHQIM